MRTSESIERLAPALLKAQKALEVAVKDSANPYFKSNYADITAVIDVVKPALNDAGISFVQLPDTGPEAGLLYLTTRLIHTSGEWLESTAATPLAKTDPQAYGSAITYTRRYALAAAIGLLAEDDDANAATGKREPAPSPKAKPLFPGVTR
jgi:hypothetical protein